MEAKTIEAKKMTIGVGRAAKTSDAMISTAKVLHSDNAIGNNGSADLSNLLLAQTVKAICFPDLFKRQLFIARFGSTATGIGGLV